MTVGDRIKKRREEIGMSQTELATKIGSRIFHLTKLKASAKHWTFLLLI